MHRNECIQKCITRRLTEVAPLRRTVPRACIAYVFYSPVYSPPTVTYTANVPASGRFLELNPTPAQMSPTGSLQACAAVSQ
jgi:hypothetical protein